MNKTALFLLLCIDHKVDVMDIVLTNWSEDMHDALKYIKEQELVKPSGNSTTFDLTDKGWQVIKLVENNLND